MTAFWEERIWQLRQLRQVILLPSLVVFQGTKIKIIQMLIYEQN